MPGTLTLTARTYVVGGFVAETSSVGMAMFTLILWTLGEVGFTSEDASDSISQPAIFILVVTFVALSE